jgi:hypothetical protein
MRLAGIACPQCGTLVPVESGPGGPAVLGMVGMIAAAMAKAARAHGTCDGTASHEAVSVGPADDGDGEEYREQAAAKFACLVSEIGL